MISCEVQCTSDDACEDHQRCCTIGCSTMCLETESLPFYSAPRICPERERLLLCSEDTETCQNNTHCGENMLCCDIGCGKMCELPVISNTPCTTIANQIEEALENTLAIPPNVYIPQCRPDGFYAEIQCQPSINVCWCAEEENGHPLAYFSRESVSPCTGSRRANLLNSLSYWLLFFFLISLYVQWKVIPYWRRLYCKWRLQYLVSPATAKVFWNLSSGLHLWSFFFNHSCE